MLKIHHTNFWKFFNHTNFFIHKLLSSRLDIKYVDSSIESSDILFCSLFGDKGTIIEKIDTYKGTKILISLENLNHQNHKWIQKYLNKFNFIFGLNNIQKDNYYRIPFYIKEYFDLEEKLITINQNKIKQVCLIANNPQKLRLELISKFKNSNTPVDCPGKVGKNISVSIKPVNKINFIKNYSFNICPENSYDIGYTTEKLFHALYAGSVPIYWGDISCDLNFYNEDKILQINQTQSNIDEIIDKCIYLLSHNNEYKKIEYLLPFKENYLDVIDEQISKICKIFTKILIN